MHSHDGSRQSAYKEPASDISGQTAAILLLAIIALSLLFRLFFIKQLAGTVCYNPVGVDEVFYDNWALSISRGCLIGKTAFNGMPLYPYLVGLIYAIFGHSVTAVRCVQASLGTLNCVLIYFVARQVFSRKVGLLSAFLLSLYGLFLFYEGYLLDITLSIFLTLSVLSLLLYSFSRDSSSGFFASGLALGFSSLTRAGILFFVPFTIFCIFYFSRRKALAALASVLLLVGIAFPISLSVLHNYMAEKDIVFLSAHGGVTFYNGNNPNSEGPYFSPLKELNGADKAAFIQDAKDVAEKEAKRHLKSSEVSNYWFRKSLRFIINNPYKYATILFSRILALFNKYEFYDTSISYVMMKQLVPVLGVSFLTFPMIFPFALLGMLLSLKPAKGPLLLWGYIISYSLFSLFFMIFSRYRLPLLPVFIIFAAYGICRIWEDIRTRGNNLPRYAVVLVLAALLVNAPLSAGASEVSGGYNFLGLAYNKAGDYDAAIETFKIGLSIDPEGAELYNNLGQAFLCKGMISEAEKNIKKAITIRPQFAEAHTTLGTIYKDKGLLDESLEEHKKAAALRPDNPQIYINLGNTYGRKGQYAAAIEQFKKSLSLLELPECYDSLAVTYMKLGEKDAAIAAWEKALKLDPGFEKAKKNLSKYKK